MEYGNFSPLDANHFFSLSSDANTFNLSLSEIIHVTEGAGAIIIWNYLYEFFSLLGFEKGPYIGIILNITLIALAAVVGIKVLKILYGNDESRMMRFTLFFGLCGTFWLFASLHVRDSFILFAMTLFLYCWVRYLAQFNVMNLVLLFLATFVSFEIFGYLRYEFALIPFALLAAGAVAVLGESLCNKGSGLLSAMANTLSLIIVVSFAYFLSKVGFLSSFEYIPKANALPVMGSSHPIVSTILDTLNVVVDPLFSGNEQYMGDSREESGGVSLGFQMIVNQALPIRLILGSAYLYIFPIPFWMGFQVESSYDLFKSLHVLYMYVITPLFMLAMARIFFSKELQTKPILFLLFTLLGFTLSVSYTSLETRHLGPFLPALILLAMIPDLTVDRDRLLYRNTFAVFLCFIATVHVAWAILKFAL